RSMRCTSLSPWNQTCVTLVGSEAPSTLVKQYRRPTEAGKEVAVPFGCRSLTSVQMAASGTVRCDPAPSAARAGAYRAALPASRANARRRGWGDGPRDRMGLLRRGTGPAGKVGRPAGNPRAGTVGTCYGEWQRLSRSP